MEAEVYDEGQKSAGGGAGVLYGDGAGRLPCW